MAPALWQIIVKSLHGCTAFGNAALHAKQFCLKKIRFYLEFNLLSCQL